IWDADFSALGSWIWRRLMDGPETSCSPFSIMFYTVGRNIVVLARQLDRVGFLIEITGANGPRLLRVCLPAQPPTLIHGSDDYFLWRTSADIASTCLLCGIVDESRDHIYFSCSYSRSVWDFFFTQTSFNQPYTFGEVIRWVHHSTPPGKIRTICKLVMQAVFYALWNERNKRLHTSVARHPQLIIKEIQIILKANLYGMDQNVGNTNRISSVRSNPGDRYLHLWFQNFPS
ncbi:unnamed protein product, partial [Brassica oleracea var. botrytis]